MSNSSSNGKLSKFEDEQDACQVEEKILTTKTLKISTKWKSTSRKKGEILLSDTDCQCVTMNKNGDIYVSDHVKNDVQRWKNDDKYAKTVAGGNNRGKRLDQLDFPTYIYVDDQLSIYISDTNNHRVVKWLKGARKGVVGANDQGQTSNEVIGLRGLSYDRHSNLYFADTYNHRIQKFEVQ